MKDTLYRMKRIQWRVDDCPYYISVEPKQRLCGDRIYAIRSKLHENTIWKMKVNNTHIDYNITSIEQAKKAVLGEIESRILSVMTVVKK